ncbi:hypothetical protein GCM10017774_78560 [Lentzea cavernae]|uniref:Uncharacterized protein n=1 Tax=Lentzea cavernae TaxID=2020703 RepID=A0ABQ3MQP0_9PSEU|nr:hypothetical protein GCM10017774_78560 [Lentzea cavernae]
MYPSRAEDGVEHLNQGGTVYKFDAVVVSCDLQRSSRKPTGRDHNAPIRTTASDHSAKRPNDLNTDCRRMSFAFNLNDLTSTCQVTSRDHVAPTVPPGRCDLNLVTKLSIQGGYQELELPWADVE